jgi:hypothetical protein
MTTPEPTRFIMLYLNGDAWVVADIDLRKPEPPYRNFTDLESALTQIKIKAREIKMERLEEGEDEHLV